MIVVRAAVVSAMVMGLCGAQVVRAGTDPKDLAITADALGPAWTLYGASRTGSTDEYPLYQATYWNPSVRAYRAITVTVILTPSPALADARVDAARQEAEDAGSPTDPSLALGDGQAWRAVQSYNGGRTVALTDVYRVASVMARVQVLGSPGEEQLLADPLDGVDQQQQAALRSLLPDAISVPRADGTYSSCAPGKEPSFNYGFAELKATLGASMGAPAECEYTVNGAGDTQQGTTTGTATYRSRTNEVAFTNGPHRWLLTDQGPVLQST